MKNLNLMISVIAISCLMGLAQAVENPIDKGVIIDRKTGDEIHAACDTEKCGAIQFYVKSGETEFDIGIPYATQKFADEAKQEHDKNYPQIPWFAATQLSSVLINYTGGASYLAYTLVVPLAVFEGVADVIMAPGYGIAELVQRARIKNIEAALNGQTVEVSHFRFNKIQKLIVAMGEQSN